MKKVFVGLVVLLLGVGAGWYVFGGYSSPKEESTSMPVPGTTGVEEKEVMTEETPGVRLSDIANTVVTYTDSGFAPKDVTVKKSTTVTFVNGSSSSMWVASAPHPTHTNYPEFDQLKSVGKGQTYEFTFDKVGMWKYHNHMKPTDFGSVTVTE